MLSLFAARPDADGLHRRVAANMSAAWRLALAPLEADEARSLARSLSPIAAGCGRARWRCRAEPSMPGARPARARQRRHQPGFSPRTSRGAARSALPEAARDLLRIVVARAPSRSRPAAPRAGGSARHRAGVGAALLEAQRYVRPTASAPLRIEPYHDRIAECVTSSTRRRRAFGCTASSRRCSSACSPQPSRARSCFTTGKPASSPRRCTLPSSRPSRRLFGSASTKPRRCSRSAVELAPDEGARRRFAVGRAQALVNAGRDCEAAEILRGLARDEPSPQPRFELACQAATLFFQSGYADDALAVLDPWLRELGNRPHGTRAAELVSVLYHRARAALAPSSASATPARRPVPAAGAHRTLPAAGSRVRAQRSVARLRLREPRPVASAARCQ